MQHTTAKHNPLTFYLRMLLYMLWRLLLRLLALAPLACLFVFPAGSPLKLLALLCPVLLVLLVLPLRYSFAEAMVRRDGRAISALTRRSIWATMAKNWRSPCCMLRM